MPRLLYLKWKGLFILSTTILGIGMMLCSLQLIAELRCPSSVASLGQLSEIQADVRVFGGLPHVDACHRCHTCHVPVYTEASEYWFRRRSRDLMLPTLPREVQLSQIYDKSHYPECTSCWGCRQTVHPLSRDVSAFDVDGYETAPGMSNAHVYSIRDPNLGNEESIVKLWCVEASSKPKKKRPPPCRTSEMLTSIQMAVAVQKIIDECHFRDIVSNVWVAPVNAVLPKTGFHVDWEGLWSEKAKGVPLEAFVEDSIDNGMDPALFEDYMNNRVNSSEIVMAAVLDLLSSQGDRHTQNVFFSETGHITLIDNDEALGHAWRPVGVDSIFLPTTQYHTMQHVGQRYLRRKTNRPRSHPLASVVFDYRCHVPNGRIGTDYPPQVTQVMQRIVHMTVEDVKEHYSLPDVATASRLIQRAHDMLTKGFEWTLEFGEPTNAKSLKYPWHPPCCKIRVVTGTSDVECADLTYERDFTRPPGDATFGDS